MGNAATAVLAAAAAVADALASAVAAFAASLASKAICAASVCQVGPRLRGWGHRNVSAVTPRSRRTIALTKVSQMLIFLVFFCMPSAVLCPMQPHPCRTLTLFVAAIPERRHV